MVYEVTIPTAHSISKITQIVQSMLLRSLLTQSYVLQEPVQTARSAIWRIQAVGDE